MSDLLGPPNFPDSRPSPSTSRSHRGYVRNPNPVIPASAPRATPSPCPGGNWREAASWAEVRARRAGRGASSGGAGGGGWMMERSKPSRPRPWAGPPEPLPPQAQMTPRWNPRRFRDLNLPRCSLRFQGLPRYRDNYVIKGGEGFIRGLAGAHML